MSDTRTRQMAALIDDARTLAADMSDELTSNHLAALRCSLNVSLRYVHMLERELTDGM